MSKFAMWMNRARAALTPSDAAWRGARAALLVLWVIVLVWVGADEVGRFFSVEKIAGFVAIFAMTALATLGLLLVLWLVRLLAPGYRFALFLVILPLALFMLAAWAQGVFIALPVLVLGVSLFFGALASYWSQRPRLSYGTAIYGGIGAVLLGLCVYAIAVPQGDLNPALDNFHLKGTTLALADPGKPGPYKVVSFTYGSGTDVRRPEYAKGARFITRSVDGAKLDSQWTSFGGWLRTRYWGFDSAHMPLQGRVWMPEGPGPFPLVLIVHGNHEMEDYSDPGYEFLGKLFASQGFILVSVDENFLNSSVSDFADVFHFRGGNENRARGWLLLEHLAQWREWTADPRHALHGKADMDSIALIGHSRGGEAVAVANAFNNLDHFPDDATVPFNFHFHLRGIAAIAPIDRQYEPRDRPTPMHDQNYFVIQGSMDGDVFWFAGSAQYSRADFSPGSDAFKASLYVKGANHGQFNTGWGRTDVGLPFQFVADNRPIMDPEAQRRILSVYLSAFLKTTLLDQTGYRALFQDPRNGADWLPDDYLVHNYADGKTQWLATYDDDLDPSTGAAGVAIDGHNLTQWFERWAELKTAALDTQVAFVAWDSRVHRKGAAYQLQFKSPPPATADTALVFGASEAGIETLPKDSKIEGERNNDDKTPLDWSIVVTDSNGQMARLPLSHDQPLYHQVKGETRRAGMIDFLPHSEIVMRRFRLPLRDFTAANPKLDLAQLREIAFVFDRSPRGAIALDDIGLAPGATVSEVR